jgi:phosphatidylinositol-3-phosphatase
MVGKMKKLFIMAALSLVLSACSFGGQTASSPSPEPDLAGSQAAPQIPDFDHIIVIMLENRDYDQVIGNEDMPFFNQLADENVQFTNYYAVTTEASLPNYLALIGGDTFGITNNCRDCWIDAPSLPDLLEAAGKTWKTYQEDLPVPCFIGDEGDYKQKHNPFVYFNPIREDAKRCEAGIVSLDVLEDDLANNELPDFTFITPNMCNGGHDCDLDVVDEYLSMQLDQLMQSPALGDNYMIFIGFEESKHDKSSCCGMPDEAGGRVPAILISPQAQQGYQEDTPLSHYSLLKTILGSWGLGDLGHTADPESLAITAPWQ